MQSGVGVLVVIMDDLPFPPDQLLHSLQSSVFSSKMEWRLLFFVLLVNDRTVVEQDLRGKHDTL